MAARCSVLYQFTCVGGWQVTGLVFAHAGWRGGEGGQGDQVLVCVYFVYLLFSGVVYFSVCFLIFGLQCM